MLHQIEHGAGNPGPPIVIAHGLFGSARNWGGIARTLAASRRVIAVDMRNHGRSPHDPDHSYPALADDLARVIGDDAPADVVGHSMGGKAAMVLALSRPEAVRRLVVGDIAPVAYGHSQSELIDAMRGVDPAAVNSRGEADRALAERVEDPMVRGFLLQSLDLAGRRWQLNLDALDAAMPLILGFPEIEGRFDGPALFLSGARSDYVRDAHRDRIRALFPAAEFVEIPEAGHWFHAEKPAETIAALRGFLD